MKKKSTWASLAIIPAVLGGLLLLGFQTYMLFTGKSFSDLDFGIGKLWQNPEKVIPTQNAPTSFQFIKPLLKEQEQRFSLFEDLKNSVPTYIAPKREVHILNPTQETNKSAERDKSGFFEVESIDQIKIYSVTKGKQYVRYAQRLEREYLINPNLKPQKGKWFVGFSFSPTLNYRTFSYDPTRVSGVAVEGNRRYTFGLTESQRNISDKSITSYTVGIDLGRQLTPRVDFYTGLHYAQYGEQILVCGVDANDPNLGHSSFHGERPHYQVFDEKNSHINLPFKNTYSFLEIPLGLSLELFSREKSSVRAEVGLALQKMVGVNALVYDFETDYYYWMDEKNEVFRSFGLGSQLGVSFSQYVGDRTEVFANPQFKFNLNSTFQEPYPVTQNQYTTGLRLGVRHHIN